jgi:hypothetical protein
MSGKLIKVGRSGLGLSRCLFVGVRELSNIIIYGNGKILFETYYGWFETCNEHDRYSHNDIIEFTITEPVKALKENLSRKDNYYMLSKDRILGNTYILFIHESEISVTNRHEFLVMETETARNYLTGADLFFHLSPVKIQTYQGIKELNSFFSTERYYTKTEKTTLGQKIDNIQETLKTKNIKITSYDIQRLLEIYDLIPKNN